jgi:hypothetical protein
VILMTNLLSQQVAAQSEAETTLAAPKVGQNLAESEAVPRKSQLLWAGLGLWALIWTIMYILATLQGFESQLRALLGRLI